MATPPTSARALTTAVTALGLVLPLSLACSGLPIPDGLVGGGTEEDDAAEEGEEGKGEEDAEDVAEAPKATPESLFAVLDGDEVASYPSIGDMECPTGTTKVRHPKGGRLNVFCGAGNGTRQGPYGEWAGNSLREAGTYVDGKFDGPYTHWNATGDKERPLRKVKQETYAAGVLQGDYAEWDLKGNLVVRGTLQAGKRTGRFLEAKQEGEATVFAGACYADGAEVWRTTDEAEFTSKDCAEAASPGPVAGVAG